MRMQSGGQDGLGYNITVVAQPCWILEEEKRIMQNGSLLTRHAKKIRMFWICITLPKIDDWFASMFLESKLCFNVLWFQ